MVHCLDFKDILSFGVELGLNNRSINGLEDGPTLAIKGGIDLTLGIKPASTDSPGAGYEDGALLGFKYFFVLRC
jgi:hypothetical protein